MNGLTPFSQLFYITDCDWLSLTHEPTTFFLLLIACHVRIVTKL